jgi:transcriptional regulator with XRE-family HTH domain
MLQPVRGTMTPNEMTFGRAIAMARKAMGLSQKDLAAMILKEDGTGPISPQYLNDIEHDRRSPTSDHLILQFANVLGKDPGYLFVLAGKIPEDMRRTGASEREISRSFANFRRDLNKAKRKTEEWS